MKRLPRSTALQIAAVISFVTSLIWFLTSIPYLARGAAAVSAASDAPPYVVVISSFVLVTVALVSAYGVWQNRRWAIILTILAHALNGLSAAPGVLFAPTPQLWIAATSTVIVAVIVIALCLWREPKAAVL